MSCLCDEEHMHYAYTGQADDVNRSDEYGKFSAKFYLEEEFGIWDLVFKDKENYNYTPRMEIFYCPFCGRKLNTWHFAEEHREGNFKKFVKEDF